jgi:hypothetical protein
LILSARRHLFQADIKMSQKCEGGYFLLVVLCDVRENEKCNQMEMPHQMRTIKKFRYRTPMRKYLNFKLWHFTSFYSIKFTPRNLNRGLQFEQRSHSTKRWEKFVARSKQQTPTSARAFLQQTQISAGGVLGFGNLDCFLVVLVISG